MILFIFCKKYDKKTADNKYFSSNPSLKHIQQHSASAMKPFKV